MLWDTTSWKPISEPLPAFSDHISHIVFNMDGKTMVSTGGEGSFVLWDLATQQPLGNSFRLRTSPVPVLSVVLIEDGESLVSLYEDGPITSWDTTSEFWHAQLCEKAGRNFTQEEWAFYFPGEPYRKTCEQWSEGK
jgi:WD40 repeat protein